MPCDHPDLRADLAMRPNFEVPNPDVLGPNVEDALTTLFEKEIAFNRVMEEMKQKIECSKQFSYEKAFQEIDDWSYGYVDSRNLKSFLRKHGFLAKKGDLLAIIRRMDLDGDARLTLTEFVQAMKPTEPYSKLVKR
jgi:Ca2+-binding EF-hand superfamily protein